jgi:hypothetical protein
LVRKSEGVGTTFFVKIKNHENIQASKLAHGAGDTYKKKYIEKPTGFGFR